MFIGITLIVLACYGWWIAADNNDNLMGSLSGIAFGFGCLSIYGAW